MPSLSLSGKGELLSFAFPSVMQRELHDQFEFFLASIESCRHTTLSEAQGHPSMMCSLKKEGSCSGGRVWLGRWVSSMWTCPEKIRAH